MIEPATAGSKSLALIISSSTTNQHFIDQKTHFFSSLPLNADSILINNSFFWPQPWKESAPILSITPPRSNSLDVQLVAPKWADDSTWRWSWRRRSRNANEVPHLHIMKYWGHLIIDRHPILWWWPFRVATSTLYCLLLSRQDGMTPGNADRWPLKAMLRWRLHFLQFIVPGFDRFSEIEMTLCRSTGWPPSSGQRHWRNQHSHPRTNWNGSWPVTLHNEQGRFRFLKVTTYVLCVFSVNQQLTTTCNGLRLPLWSA